MAACAFCDRPAVRLSYCSAHYQRLYRLHRGHTNPETHCWRCGRRTKVSAVFDGYCYACHLEMGGGEA